MYNPIDVMSTEVNTSENLATRATTPLTALEQHILQHQTAIEAWFEQQWENIPAPFYSSVDLRNAHFKLSPIDTNLFPAGFNNLGTVDTARCREAVQAALTRLGVNGKQVLILPEDHTRNRFYLQNVFDLQHILINAGLSVRVGSLREDVTAPQTLTIPSGDELQLEPVTRVGDQLQLNDFTPDIILLNNDLTSGIPPLLQDLTQAVLPPPTMGWHHRRKSTHFTFYQQAADALGELIDLDPWLLAPLFRDCGDIDFMHREGEDCLIINSDKVFHDVEQKYQQYDIHQKPFVFIKADAGTYGMGVMPVYDPQTIRTLNRKQRTRMSASKGKQSLNRAIIQEGVMTAEMWGDKQGVAEPVIYLIGGRVIGGFYRIHEERGSTDNLNAPGMTFVPMRTADNANRANIHPDRFYVYGVIARLATLAASYEIRDQV